MTADQRIDLLILLGAFALLALSVAMMLYETRGRTPIPDAIRKAFDRAD